MTQVASELRSEAGPLVAPTRAGPRRRVLVVEDEPGLLELLKLHLQVAGFDVASADDGLEALYALDRERPDLVILDLMLPKVSGFRLLQLLKQGESGPSAPPVMVLTALSFQEAKDALRAGADAFVSKPFLPHDVVARARSLLGQRLEPQPVTAVT